MGRRSRGAVLAWACGALLGCAPLRAQGVPIWVELSCSIAADSGLAAGRILLVEVRTPGGETVCQALASAGHSVRFRRLKPGIFIACVTDRAGGCRCQSVDLYPPPKARTASFSVQLIPPAPAAQAEPLYLIDKAQLVIPEKARRAFGQFENLGSSCCLAGNYIRAAQLFERVTEIAPKMCAGWLDLGVTLLITGDPRRALQAEMHALKLCPDDPFVLYQVGLCHYQLGEFDAARGFLERVIELDPYSATYPHLTLARIAVAEGRQVEVARLLREVSRLHPHAPRPPGTKELMSRLEYMPQP
jgi:hypothetical protein